MDAALLQDMVWHTVIVTWIRDDFFFFGVHYDEYEEVQKTPGNSRIAQMQHLVSTKLTVFFSWRLVKTDLYTQIVINLSFGSEIFDPVILAFKVILASKARS